MSAKDRQRNSEKVRFSIRAKLILIVSFIITASFIFITVFISGQIRTDARIKAEAANLEINRLTARDVDFRLMNIKSNVNAFIQASSVLSQESVDLFFDENPDIIAVFFNASGNGERLLFNRRFFSLLNIDENAVLSYFDDRRFELNQADKGEVSLLNAAPRFSGQTLALFFPWQNGSAGALFSSEKINSYLSYGINQSYLININGVILAHSNYYLVKDGISIADLDYIRQILNSTGSERQNLFESDFGVFMQSAYTPKKDMIQNVWDNVKSLIKPVTDRLSGFLFKNKIIKEMPSRDGSSGGISGMKMRQFVAYTELNSAAVIVLTSIEHNRVFEDADALIRNITCIAAVILLFSVIIIALFSGSISVPLKSLALAARQIENGNFDYELKINNHDETGALNYSFQKMCSALNVFGSFTDREIVSKAMRGEIKSGGVPKQCTVFFSDIHGFAEITNNFSMFFGNEGPDKIVQWLNQYYAGMIECVEKTNGVVDKLIGDALMAHWGTVYSTGSPRKDAFACVKSALMMRKILYFMNKDRKPGDYADPEISIGCGISSGIVTAGRLGSEKHMEYTVIGEPVNTAAQINSSAKMLGADIVISEDTWNLVGDKFVTEELPPVNLKGKERPVRVFAVINFLREPKGPQNLNDVRTLLGINPPVPRNN